MTTDIESLFTLEEAKQMRRRAQAFANLAYAAEQQWRDPSGFRDRHLAHMIRICRLHGLSEAEVKATIQQVREEEAA